MGSLRERGADIDEKCGDVDGIETTCANAKVKSQCGNLKRGPAVCTLMARGRERA
jgi:hypothetical protein